METISAKTYHRGLGVGFADSAETRGLFEMALDHGWLRAYVLYVRGTPYAFWEGLMYRQSFFPISTAYDPALEEHRPGAFLLMHIVEQLCGERVNQIDFGLGDANYKRWYSNQNWQEAALCIYAPSMKGLALFMLKTPMALMEHTMKKSLEKARLLQRVKTLWRRHVCGRQQEAPAG
jgi:CelD/BcsL family acetyltransferase involved in cellulose biosynthesis